MKVINCFTPDNLGLEVITLVTLLSYNKHSGFRSNHSCQTTLICCTPCNLGLEVITFVKLLSYNRQYGFRSNHSCQTALIQIIDEWLYATDNNEIVGTAYIDLSKEFDLVNHDIV